MPILEVWRPIKKHSFHWLDRMVPIRGTLKWIHNVVPRAYVLLWDLQCQPTFTLEIAIRRSKGIHREHRVSSNWTNWTVSCSETAVLSRQSVVVVTASVPNVFTTNLRTRQDSYHWGSNSVVKLQCFVSYISAVLWAVNLLQWKRERGLLSSNFACY